MNRQLHTLKKKSAQITIAILILLILATVVYFASRLVQFNQTAVEKPASAVVGKGQLQLSDQSLFGHYSPRTEPQLADIGMSLVGVLANPGDEHDPASRVVLKSASGDSKVYHIGDSLPGGYVITAIQSEKLLLTNSQGFPFYIKLVKPSLNLVG